MKTQIDLLSALPVRILKPITSTRTVSKADMLADLAFNLDASGIVVTESVLDADFLVFKYNGEKVGAIDVRRGRQEFQLISGEWSTDWSRFMAYLIVQKRGIQATQAEQQDESLDHLDSYTDDERDFIREFGELADNILSQIGRTDTLRLVKDDRGNYRVCDDERDGEDILWTQSDSRLWGTSVYKWGQLTVFPLQHLTDYVNKLNQSSND